MISGTFLKLFPPPKFMMMGYSGLDISDDAVHWIKYISSPTGERIESFGKVDLPEGIIEGGDVKDRVKLIETLSKIKKENNLSFVRVSLPEEKVYLFQTEVPETDFKNMRENIEFKLEENVPLSAPDALFYFDTMPFSTGNSILRASVSVVPRSYVEQYISLLRDAGLFAVAFEVVPKAIARAVVPANSKETNMIVNIMNKKTGIYVTYGSGVCFTSTVGIGINSVDPSGESYCNLITREINRVYAYWVSHGIIGYTINKIILTGRVDEVIEDSICQSVFDTIKTVVTPDPWHNVIDFNHYIPSIHKNDSFEYSVSAGLAMPKIK